MFCANFTLLATLHQALKVTQQAITGGCRLNKGTYIMDFAILHFYKNGVWVIIILTVKVIVFFFK